MLAWALSITRGLLFLAQWCILVWAACVDARDRVFPNGLALALAAVCALFCAVTRSPSTLLLHALEAAAFCGLLVVFEMAWRRRKGASGIGMGDIKCLFALMLVSPLEGVLSFAGALALLAVAGAALGRGSLPLLPFLVAAYAVASLLL